jgi:DNA-binding MarR family transcriptional regulator
MVEGPTRTAMSDEDKRALRDLLNCLDIFADMRPAMALQAMRSYLLVALQEGLGVTELANKAGIKQAVMSRHLQDIGTRDRYLEEGLGLVDQRALPMELRKHEVFLTPKGRALAHRLVRMMKRG